MSRHRNVRNLTADDYGDYDDYYDDYEDEDYHDNDEVLQYSYRPKATNVTAPKQQPQKPKQQPPSKKNATPPPGLAKPKEATWNQSQAAAMMNVPSLANNTTATATKTQQQQQDESKRKNASKGRQRQEEEEEEEPALNRRQAAAMLSFPTAKKKETETVQSKFPPPLRPVSDRTASSSSSSGTSLGGRSTSAGSRDLTWVEKSNRIASLCSIMELSTAKAQASLEDNGWNVERAINALLLASVSDTAGVAAGTTPLPPAAHNSSKSNASSRAVSIGSVGSESTGGGAASGSIKVETMKKNKSRAASEKKEDAAPPPKVELTPDVKARIGNTKSRLSMVVLGHVDAGKSTLMGQVLVQLGHVEKRTITKYQRQANEIGKASFALAWVMDEDETERERGVTMEVATKFVSTPQHDLTILDAPGHADFIPGMIGGAALADVGILVVAATVGEFEAGFEVSDPNKSVGQTREHVVLARGLGVSQLIVAVNKLDAVDWDEERWKDIQSRLEPFLCQAGFAAKRIRFVPVSGLQGTNVSSSSSSSSEPKLSAWYHGPTLLQAIDLFLPATRAVEKPLRFLVSDIYPEGKGILARGRVAQGFVSAGDKVVVLPIGDEATVSRVEHSVGGGGGEDSLTRVAIAGDAVDVILSGIDIARVAPGNVLSWLSMRPSVRQRVEAKILVMEQLAMPLIRGTQVSFHMHSLDVPAVLSRLLSLATSDAKQKPRLLRGGVSAHVEIKLMERQVLEEYRHCRALGRFVLRRGGDTVAVGVIEKVL